MIRPSNCSGIWQPCQPAFLEGAADPAEVPGIFIRLETVGQILWTQDPRIVRQPAVRIGADIGINRLAGRWHADRRAVEREVLRVLHEVEKVGMAAAELLRTVDPKSVVPDHPAAASEPQFPLEDELEVSRVIVSNCQPIRTRRLQNPMDGSPPCAAPLQVLFCIATIIVDVIVIANVERRIGKHQVNAAWLEPPEPGNAIPFIKLIRFHFRPRQRGTSESA